MFLSRGLLGCQSCYDSFAPEIEPLLEEYQNHTPAPHRVSAPLNRMALARTQEALDFIKGPGEPFDSPVLSPSSISERVIEPLPPGFPADFDSTSSDNDSNNGWDKYSRKGGGFLLSCRVRLARNLQGLEYLSVLNAAERERLNRVLLGEHTGLVRELAQVRQKRLKRQERSSDTSVSLDFARIPLTLYSGDEDHLRARWIIPVPPEIKQTRNSSEFRHFLLPRLARVQAEIARINRLYAWQFHPLYGYQTACPANSGGGIRVSFLVDITHIINSGNWPGWKMALEQAGLEVRGAGGEGSRLGKRVQISNRHWPPGANPEEIIGRIMIIINRLAPELSEKK